MSDDGVIKPRIQFDTEDVKSITIPQNLPDPIHQDDDVIPVPEPTPAQSIPVPSESGIAVPDNLPIEVLDPERVVQITIPTEMPEYTIKERLDEELSPGAVSKELLQEADKLLNPNLPEGPYVGKVSYNGEPPRFLIEHLSRDFVRIENTIFINREALSQAGEYYFVLTDSEKSGRIDFVKAVRGTRDEFIVTATSIMDSIESSNYKQGETGFGITVVSGVSSMELDNLIARGSIRSLLDESNRIRSTRGSLFAGGGSPIGRVEVSGLNLVLTLFEPVTFAVDDILITRRIVTGTTLETFWLVKSVNPAQRQVTVVKLSGSDFDITGCVPVLVGNVSVASRQGSVYLTEDLQNAPRLEVLSGVNSVEAFQALPSIAARVGNLNGITDDILGVLDGYGIYAKRLFGYGTLMISKESRFYHNTGYITAQNIVDYFTANDTTLQGIAQTIAQINQTLQWMGENYYTKTNLNTSGQAQVHWDNITGKPPIPETKHMHQISEVVQLPEELAYIKYTYCTKEETTRRAVTFSIALG